MPDLAVNILYFGNLPSRDVNDFATRLEEVYTSNWSEKDCGFIVSAKGNVLTVSKKIKDKEKEFTAVMVNEPYSGDYNNRGTLREWANKYGLIVMVCHAGEYHENRIDILRVRNVMREENRRNDSILILTAVEQMMETIGEYRNDIEKAVAVYSALTGSPYSCETKLKGPSFLLPLYGEDTCQYTHRTTGRVFSMPINLLCDLDYASAYEPLLTEIIKRLLVNHNMKLIGYNTLILNKHNNYFMKFKDFFRGYKSEIRLAVVGIPAAGKTYLLEDIVNLLTNKNFMAFESARGDDRFKTFTDFLSDTTSTGYKLTEQTPRYACRHKNQYCQELCDSTKRNKFKLTFLDVPGELIKKQIITVKNEEIEFDIYPKCKALYDGIKKIKKDIFIVKTWTDNHGYTKKTIEYDKGEELKIDDLIWDENSNTYQKYVVDTARHESYAKKEDIFSYMNQNYKRYEEAKVSGKKFIEDFYEFDADSAYHTLVDMFNSLQNYDINLNVDREIFTDYVAYGFYFYYFLFQATDVVLLEKILNGDTGEQEVETWFNRQTALGPLKNDNPKIRFYLGIKGADTFFRNKQFKNCYENAGQSHNEKYSGAVLSVVKVLKGESSDLVKISENNMGRISDAFEGFSGLIGGERYNEMMTRHTYLVATPIDSKYNIDAYTDNGISGRSQDPNYRCFFGSLQLIEDVLKAHEIVMPAELQRVPEDGFLNFIRGTDRH